MPRALLSVSDKTGLVDLARGLVQRRFDLVSTGGTAAALTAAGLPVVNVSTVTGFPEMMDGRVKTLHPNVHAGILARRDHPEDLAALSAHGITPIDVVVVNLYPFAATAANPSATFDDLVEKIDIGGPSMVRAAAKNFPGVLVLVDPADYGTALAALDAPGGPTPAFRFDLARKAIAHTAAYDAAITATLAEISTEGGTFRREAAAGGFPARLELGLSKIGDLRYGENPHQQGAWYATGQEAGLGQATVLQGKGLSYTNLLDLDAAARIVLEFQEPAAAVIKHTNPCGVATGQSAEEAYVRARDTDALSAFGGIVALNRPIDEAAAREIVSTFIEAVIAPGIDDAAREVLAAKSKMRVVIADFRSLGHGAAVGSRDREVRSLLGAVLVQDRDRVVEAQDPWTPEALPEGVRVVTRRKPTVEEWQALRFAWRVCAHVKSNTIIFTNADRTLAIGAGQMSRVDAAKVALMKAAGDDADARVSLAGSVAASDAFFPFRDGLDVIAAAGATAVVQPGGSVRDAEVIAAADEHGLAMVFTGRRHFRH
ncbi:MAG: bifunctional phosphoribosylaminoimidazolecarboxamide formyltransferase/IMP cyclohydrolase [Acidobacteriota bacterium]|nr:bifunctional phosphoribosylaminoimidazolecarboxamide formyltransferase/IMP cyclohydrolase [Acidobacteriota bacterium]